MAVAFGCALLLTTVAGAGIAADMVTYAIVTAVAVALTRWR